VLHISTTGHAEMAPSHCVSRHEKGLDEGQRPL
jgi:hypothetical protein